MTVKFHKLSNLNRCSRWLLSGMLLFPVCSANSALQYQTRSESVTWEAEGNKFACRLTHPVEGFGDAVFEQQAGEQTHFYLKTLMPRMKAGKAALIIRPPAWSSQSSATTLAMVAVNEGDQPIFLERQVSERMLAELEKGMLLDFRRKPVYGDSQSIQVTVSSIGFRQGHQEYLQCLGSLLPVNYKQVERSILYYENEEDELSDSVKKRLDKIVFYSKEDPEVKAFYLDGHTDSEGIRNENLIKSQERTQRVVDYLIEQGVPKEQIVARWHGERYPVASNRTASGRSKNRRVTVRLSKEPPQAPINPTQPEGTTEQPVGAAGNKSQA